MFLKFCFLSHLDFSPAYESHHFGLLTSVIFAKTKWSNQSRNYYVSFADLESEAQTDRHELAMITWELNTHRLLYNLFFIYHPTQHILLYPCILLRFYHSFFSSTAHLFFFLSHRKKYMLYFSFGKTKWKHKKLLKIQVTISACDYVVDHVGWLIWLIYYKWEYII